MIWEIIILILIIIISLLVTTIFYVAKKATYLSKKEKDIINFTIDIYLDYGEELDVLTDKHEIITKELNNIKKKLNE